ncbi:MAG: class I SAM-dependent methyltransferase [Pseudomonadota bacterium]|nr:class I SAM-dependent methyltransferase [Pseudomonadota bacterium]
MKRHAPAADRNRAPIAAVLRDVLPARGTVLEVASGTGEHAVYFAHLFPQLRWQPSDADPEALSSIEAWAADADAPNLLAPVVLDAASDSWPLERTDAILCINMVHISSWRTTVGLMRGAGRLLPQGGPLILYGPYRRAGVPTAPSNQAFDESLKARDPEWGLRHLEEVAAEAEANGLGLERVVEMPANNVTAIFRRLSPRPASD